MTNVTIDLTGYKDRIGSRVPAGNYLVAVDDTELTSSKANNQMINVWFRLLDGEHRGQVIVDRLTLTPNALFRVVGFMQAIGLPTERKKFQVNTASWVGKHLIITVEDGEPYQGRVKSEVRGYSKAANAQQPAELSADVDDLVEDVAEEAEAAPAEAAEELKKRVAAAGAAAAEVTVADDGSLDLEGLDDL